MGKNFDLGNSVIRKNNTVEESVLKNFYLYDILLEPVMRIIMSLNSCVKIRDLEKFRFAF